MGIILRRKNGSYRGQSLEGLFAHCQPSLFELKLLYDNALPGKEATK